jgi:hypothetical protein
MRKYYVVAEDTIHKEDLHTELTAPVGSETVPARPVELIDSMPGSEYNSTFYLTDEEAKALEQDPRVRAVCPSAEDLGLIKGKTAVRPGLYTKSTTSYQNSRNWGLIRCLNTNSSVTFGAGYGDVYTDYTYNLDGTGIDVVIIDTGVEPGHPEFAVNADGTGGSRVVDYDWTQHGFITAVPTGGFMGDFDGHGSNCASIAAGNTNGWAANAAIYSLRCVPGDTSISIYDNRSLGIVDNIEAWQSIRAFHLAKPITSTGYRRPTIVSCSYGYFKRYTRLTSITYRGVTNTVTTTTGAYGTIGAPEGGSGSCNQSYPPEDAEITSAINAGIIVVGAAGNSSHKTDVPGGLDYNNYWTEYTGFSYYYHRGGTPAGVPGVISVGCLAAFTNTSPAGEEHKRAFSETGPRIDIWAPGDYIMGAYADAAYASPAVRDPRNGFYFLNTISGTSQACPQVAGVLALACQVRPWFTATTALKFIQATATTFPINENYYSLGTSYTNLGLLQGAPAKVLYNPFKSSTPLQIN